jgi:DNA-binding MarR family transcriptional regulator
MSSLSRAQPDTSLRRRSSLVHIDASTSVVLDETLQFMRELWAAVHALQKASKRMNRQMGITGPQRLVLRVVGLSPGISAGGLARVLHLHPSTLTGVLKRLEQQQLLSRVADAADGRRSVLQLTARGVRLNLASAGTVEAAVRRVLAAAPTEARRSAQAMLSALAERLDAGPRSAVTPRRHARARTA